MLRTQRARRFAVGTGTVIFAAIAIGAFMSMRTFRTHAANTQIVITSIASTTWTVPADWNNASNTIEVIGGGGGGATGASGQIGGGAGGGAAYAKMANASLTPGATVSIKIGSGGGIAAAGQDTYLCNATSNCTGITGTAVIVGAKGGSGGSGTTGGTGGASASSVGSLTASGGAGGAAAVGGGGGGGAAGPSAAGNIGGAANTTTGGTGGQGDGTAGGGGGGGGTGGRSTTVGTVGSNGTEWNGTYGSGGGGGGGGGGNFKTVAGSAGATGGTYGAGGGGGGGCNNVGCTAGAGASGIQGIIVITYTPFVPTVTVSATGTAVAAATVPSTAFMTGGAFTFTRDSGSTNITQITVTATGTLNANTNLSNLILYYQQSSSCATSSVPAGATQFNATGGSFNASEQSAVTGSLSVGTANVCLYATVNIGSGAGSGQTFSLEIANPSTDVIAAAGNVVPGTAVAPAGVTTVNVPVITVGTTGTQKATTTIPKSSFYGGGAFTFTRSSASATVTQITITASGTINASANLSNLQLFYEQNSTCATSTIPSGVTAFNAAAGSFNVSGQSTVTGSMSVGTAQVCVYAQVDIGSGAAGGNTLEMEIADPATQVIASVGTVSPASVTAIAGATTLQAPAAFFIEQDYRIYGNVDAVQPTVPLAAQDASATAIAQNQVIRILVNIVSSGGPTPTSSQAFKLQYAPEAGFASCSAVPSGNFADVGAFASSTPWIGFNNASTTDGTPLTATLLASSTVPESYVEENPSPANPNTIPANGLGEWDFVVENNGATNGAGYCFRAVQSNGSALAQYDNLPEAWIVRPLFQVYYRWRNNDGGE